MRILGSRRSVPVVAAIALTSLLGAFASSSAAHSADFRSRLAANPVIVFYDGGAVRKPRAFDSAKVVTSAGTSPFDETVYEARRLRWKHWGSSTAIGRGKVTFCVIEYIPCSTRRATVRLSTIWHNGCADVAYRNYRYAQWNFPGHNSVKIELGPDC